MRDNGVSKDYNLLATLMKATTDLINGTKKESGV
jgi:hypothetical protein